MILVPEPVAVTELFEGKADETAEGGANHGSWQGALAHTTAPEIDVVRVSGGGARA